MDGIARESLLYDYYGALLTEKKRQVLELYHEDDMSLSEIADELGISRVAVHDALKTAEKHLEEYEAKLGLVKKFSERESLYEQAEKLKKSGDEGKKASRLSKIVERLRQTE